MTNTRQYSELIITTTNTLKHINTIIYNKTNIIAIIVKAQGNGWKLVVLGQIHNLVDG